MFGFAPKAPISPEACLWVENSLHWLGEIYGKEQWQTMPVVLPTTDFFPEDFHPTESSLQDTLNRICRFMPADPSRIVIEIRDDQEEDLHNTLKTSLPHWESSTQSAAGTLAPHTDADKFHVTIKRSQFREPISLIATLAHELGHVLLLGEKLVEREAPDMEPLTDLATVFWGFGIFTANSAARFQQYDDGTKHGWSMRRLGYLSEPMFAYALAVFAWERGERTPVWAKHLTLNVGTYFKQSLKFLYHREAKKNKE